MRSLVSKVEWILMQEILNNACRYIPKDNIDYYNEPDEPLRQETEVENENENEPLTGRYSSRDDANV